MRVLVCGTRTFGSGRHHAGIMDCTLRTLVPPGSTVVHGDARGADRLSGEWARDHGMKEEKHPANWELHGKAAGPIRNSEMLNSDIDLVFAFWDGKSRGTMDMITKAQKSYVGKNNVHIVEYK